jgi:hypothetical protein
MWQSRLPPKNGIKLTQVVSRDREEDTLPRDDDFPTTLTALSFGSREVCQTLKNRMKAIMMTMKIRLKSGPVFHPSL